MDVVITTIVLIAFTPEIDCEQPMGLPPVMSAVLLIAK
jgi:hypothetical protein